MLLYQYGMLIGEASKKLLPVEVMIIRDMPLVSLHAPALVTEPKALAGRPAPVTISHEQPLEVLEPDLVEAQTDPRLDIPKILTRRSSITRRKMKIAPFRRLTGAGKTLSVNISVEALTPEAAPAITLEPIQGLIAINTYERRTPAPSAKVLMRPETQQKAAAETDANPIAMASLEPRILTPEDEPAALKLEHPPTIPFPGSTQGASFMLLVDTSGSVKGSPLKGIKASATEFISLMGPKDRVALMTFDDTIRLINTFISIPFEKDLLKYRLRKLRTTGKLTVLNDSLLEASQILNTEDSEHLHIVLFSDGKDEGSRTTLDQGVGILKAVKISVLAVGYTRVEEKYLDILRNIADGTGGVFVQTPEFQDILTLYKSTSTEPDLTPEVLETTGGAIHVKSDPTNVQIYLNGEYLGSTPKLIKLPMGKYNLQLRSDGYHEWQAQFELSESEEVPIFVKLQPESFSN